MHFFKHKRYILLLLIVGFITYSAFLYASLPASDEQNSATVLKGKTVWQKYNCSACHQVYGLGGYLGPDLTNVYSRRNEAFIKGMVKSGTNIMPSFNLDDSEVNDLLIYFKHLDKSGNGNPKSFIKNYDGTIEQ